MAYDIEYQKALAIARSLKSEDGENNEYDRALRDFIVELFHPGESLEESQDIVGFDVGFIGDGSRGMPFKRRAFTSRGEYHFTSTGTVRKRHGL